MACSRNKTFHNANSVGIHFTATVYTTATPKTK